MTIELKKVAPQCVHIINEKTGLDIEVVRFRVGRWAEGNVKIFAPRLKKISVAFSDDNKKVFSRKPLELGISWGYIFANVLPRKEHGRKPVKVFLLNNGEWYHQVRSSDSYPRAQYVEMSKIMHMFDEWVDEETQHTKPTTEAVKRVHFVVCGEQSIEFARVDGDWEPKTEAVRNQLLRIKNTLFDNRVVSNIHREYTQIRGTVSGESKACKVVLLENGEWYDPTAQLPSGVKLFHTDTLDTHADKMSEPLVECPACGGGGVHLDDDDGFGIETDCWKCGGSGECKNDWDEDDERDTDNEDELPGANNKNFPCVLNPLAAAQEVINRFSDAVEATAKGVNDAITAAIEGKSITPESEPIMEPLGIGQLWKYRNSNWLFEIVEVEPTKPWVLVRPMDPGHVTPGTPFKLPKYGFGSLFIKMWDEKNTIKPAPEVKPTPERKVVIGSRWYHVPTASPNQSIWEVYAIKDSKVTMHAIGGTMGGANVHLSMKSLTDFYAPAIEYKAPVVEPSVVNPVTLHTGDSVVVVTESGERIEVVIDSFALRFEGPINGCTHGTLANGTLHFGYHYADRVQAHIELVEKVKP